MHVWKKDERFNWDYCELCHVVRRIDDKNRPCKGKYKLRPFEEQLNSWQANDKTHS